MCPHRCVFPLDFGHSAADLQDMSDPGESASVSEQDRMRMKWENLSKDLNTKLQLLFNTMQEEQLSSVRDKSIGMRKNLTLFTCSSFSTLLLPCRCISDLECPAQEVFSEGISSHRTFFPPVLCLRLLTTNWRN